MQLNASSKPVVPWSAIVRQERNHVASGSCDTAVTRRAGTQSFGGVEDTNLRKGPADVLVAAVRS